MRPLDQSSPVYPPSANLKRSRLLPTWIGFVCVALVGIFDLLSFLMKAEVALGACALILLSLGYFYCMAMEYQMTIVLRQQSAWWGSYSAAGVVGRQLIPIYNLYVLYTFLKEVGRYTDWRTGRSSEVGLWVFLVILATGFAAQSQPWEFIGLLGCVGGLSFLTVRIRDSC